MFGMISPWKSGVGEHPHVEILLPNLKGIKKRIKG